MAKPHTPVNIVVVSTDPDIFTQIQQDGQANGISVIPDLQGLQRPSSTPPLDGVIVDTKNGGLADLATRVPDIDLSQTFVLAGPLPAYEAAKKLGQVLGNGQDEVSSSQNRDLTLEDYVESKLGEFVRAMKLSSARSLYPTLMRAVERPLIELALRETNGNQIRASHLLGMNRNTLRKKIVEFNIPVKKIRKSN